MVPASVASYLPREEIFDLVIIDEASQMTPENSISALMRARQVLVVGDTNQLPPTGFFKGAVADESEDEDVEVVEESILELANAQFHPKHRLLWHYRSRIESLIAFSNTYVYDNDLIIFPSPVPNKPNMGVSLVRANGIYSKGINPAEAKIMLTAIVKFMTEDIERSLGVVVMNQSQMEQLDSMVLREAENNPVVAKYVDYWDAKNDGLERFFVKNLENVQGDERDVIFIGTVYGKDSLGRFYHQFGPLNGVAGKRRLNVLFTRAKEQIITFSSIPMDLMTPGEHNLGATLLKRWLEYSARGILGERLAPTATSISGPDSPFEEHVIAVIESLGFEAVPQVGVSNYYIDIGIKHHSYPLGYICGVECDGASYHSSKNARDRDRLREEVLNQLGWTLFRIWSTDWFKNRMIQTARMKEFLEGLLQEKVDEMGEIVSMPEEQGSKSGGTPGSVSGINDALSLHDERYVEDGSRVVLRMLDGGRAGSELSYKLMRSQPHQSSLPEGVNPLLLHSPLGVAVLDAAVGDQVSYIAGELNYNAEVLSVENDSQ
jgi:very-short-patch-repair endonuclease